MRFGATDTDANADTVEDAPAIKTAEADIDALGDAVADAVRIRSPELVTLKDGVIDTLELATLIAPALADIAAATVAEPDAFTAPIGVISANAEIGMLR
jgi:hypothetical protein